MKDIVFAIPSYRRADRQLAVRWLSRLGYRPSEIFVAVQSDEDRAAYSDALRGVATVFGRNGVGVSFNRNQCLSVRQDARLVMVDDGVRGVSVKTPQGKCESVKTRERLDAMLSLMFDFAERNRVDVFSLNNSSSGLCATPYDFIDHPYVSIFMGMMNRRVQFDSRVRFLEDVERACRILRGGGADLSLRLRLPRLRAWRGGRSARVPFRPAQGLRLQALHRDALRGANVAQSAEEGSQGVLVHNRQEHLPQADGRSVPEDMTGGNAR